MGTSTRDTDPENNEQQAACWSIVKSSWRRCCCLAGTPALAATASDTGQLAYLEETHNIETPKRTFDGY